MAKPTVLSVYNAARVLAGDPNGQVLTNAVLQPYYQLSFNELYRAMQSYQNPRARFESYYDLPPYTSFLDPSTAGIDNLGELYAIEERGGITEVAITGAVPGAASLAVTAVNHPFVTGNQVVQYGMLGLTDEASGLFTITKTGANTYTANGCTATGTYVSGGTASISNEKFSEVVGPQPTLNSTESVQTILREFSWENDIIRFPPCSALRQLKITYTLSGDAPTNISATIQIDDSRDFLSARTCGWALQARGNRDKSALYHSMAVGPDYDKGITGGILDKLLSSAVKTLQNLPPEQLRSQGYGPRERWNSDRLV